MSWHGVVLAGLCASYPDCCYVEIGVETGDSIRNVATCATEVHGCDIEDCSQMMPPGSTFWHMPSDRFFVEYDSQRPHIIFIDGSHRYKQVRRDFDAARKLIRPDGVIALHDTWPEKASNTKLKLCGTVYRLRRELESPLQPTGSRDQQYSIYTIGRFPGLTLVSQPLLDTLPR